MGIEIIREENFMFVKKLFEYEQKFMDSSCVVHLPVVRSIIDGTDWINSNSRSCSSRQRFEKDFALVTDRATRWSRPNWRTGKALIVRSGT
jgi:hypothetical protein